MFSSFLSLASSTWIRSRVRTVNCAVNNACLSSFSVLSRADCNCAWIVSNWFCRATLVSLLKSLKFLSICSSALAADISDLILSRSFSNRDKVVISVISSWRSFILSSMSILSFIRSGILVIAIAAAALKPSILLWDSIKAMSSITTSLLSSSCFREVSVAISSSAVLLALFLSALACLPISRLCSRVFKLSSKILFFC